MLEVPTLPLVYHYEDSFVGVEWQWTEDDDTPKSIAGYLASLMVRDADEVLVLHLDSDAQGGLQIPDGGLTGKVLANASPTKMTSGALVEGQSYSYDLQVKSSDGSIRHTFTKGPFRVDRQVTDV